jgi:exodeoxyribonuclease VII small subunit
MSDVDQKSEGETPSFEEAIRGLERVVSALERGDLDLAASLASYQQGVALLARCQGLLDGVERSVALLTGFDEAGAAVLAPFDAAPTVDPTATTTASAAADAAPAAPPKRRRAAAPKADDAFDPPF